MIIQLPYGHGILEGKLPDHRVRAIIRNALDHCHPQAGGWELVAQSLAAPIQSEPLHALAVGKKNVVLIASDHTRPVPSKLIVPQMLAEIRRGNPNADITILIATGCHRGSTKRELEAKFGPEIIARERIVLHNCTDAQSAVSLGQLPGGGELIVNRIAAEADLLVSEGFIEPHFFAGFSGGRKSILPGVASRKTVYANHCSAFIANPYARCGILDGNPIHNDMIFAARAAKLAFIVNVVINSKHEIIASYAGDCDAAHLAGTAFLSTLCSSAPQPADIVISTNNGYPLDQNIYQAVKGMCTAEATVAPHGVIVMVAACQDGHGGEAFLQTFCEDRNPGHILQKILKTPADQTAADQWQSQILARILHAHQVVLISEADDALVRKLHMIPAHSLEAALHIADQLLGRENGSITVIPEGVSSILVP